MEICMISKSIDGAPAEFQVLPYGRIDLAGEEPVWVDEEAMSSVIAGFAGHGIDMVIDYEHQTLEGTVAPAAGWIKKLINKGREGLWAVVDWTENARQYLTSKQYRYFSPVLRLRESDRRVTKIHSVALTNSPKISGLRPLLAKLTLHTPTAPGGGSLTLEALQVAKMMGNTEADLLRHIGKGYDPDALDGGTQEKINMLIPVGGGMESCRASASSPESGSLTPEALEVARQMGNTEEDLKKYAAVQ